MLRSLVTIIADAMEFLRNIPSWLEDQPTGKEFEQKMLRPELAPAKNRLPRD
jgi:hypothetical protein